MTVMNDSAPSYIHSYNGVQLAQMDAGPLVYFACTFTAMWSQAGAGAPGSTWGACLFGLDPTRGCSAVVPRYEYNNLVYAIELGDLLGPQADEVE